MHEFPDWLASTLASDATEGRGVLPPWVGSLKPDVRAVGPAFVALMSQDDNLSVRKAIQTPHSPGSVLVVAGKLDEQRTLDLVQEYFARIPQPARRISLRTLTTRKPRAGRI